MNHRSPDCDSPQVEDATLTLRQCQEEYWRLFWVSRKGEITAGSVVIENGAGQKRLPAKQVFLLTGYHPDFAFIEGLGVKLDPITKKPEMDPETHESNVPGLYLAGVVIGGRHTSEIFIENGRFHGKQIVQALTARKTQTA